jgi:hypothetical protein
MRLVFRRARGARTLLLAAVTATLIATSFVVGLLAYGRDVVSAAARSTVASAPPAERSVVVRGAADAGLEHAGGEGQPPCARRSARASGPAASRSPRSATASAGS